MYNFGFIGLGLIGGSIARGLRRAYPDCIITAHSRTPDNILPALDDGTIDFIADDIDGHFRECDVCFCCTPVLNMPDVFRSLKSVVSENCIITDVGSVKSYVQAMAEETGISYSFIGGHPMAGSEKSGYANASRSILKNRVYILTPSENTPDDKLDMLKNIIENLGCKVMITDPTEHDRAVAGISHMPHLASAALADCIRKEDENGLMKKLAGPGFLDTTRISASSPEVWTQICTANKGFILESLDKYIKELEQLRESLSEDDLNEIGRLFTDGGNYRRSIE